MDIYAYYVVVGSHSLLSKKRKSCPLFERVSYVWGSRKEEKESKEQSHVFAFKEEKSQRAAAGYFSYVWRPRKIMYIL